MRRNRRKPNRVPAFSLAEAVISIVIVGIMMVAALNLVGTSAKARLVNARLGVGQALAHELMSEVLQARYAEPNYVPEKVVGSEILLASHAPSGANNSDFKVEASKWVGQYFRPIFTIDTVEWKVTRVLLQLKANGSKTGSGWVQLRAADQSNMPAATVLTQRPLTEATFSDTSYSWYEFAFSSAPEQIPGAGMWITIAARVDDDGVCNVRYDKDTMTATGYADTDDAGSSWQRESNAELWYYVYGKGSQFSDAEPVLGSDDSEDGTDRTTFDDVDDYDGWSASPPETRDGTQLTQYEGWSRSVTVEYVSATAPDASAVKDDQGVKRITVVVTDPRGAKTTLTGLRSAAGSYEQEVAATKTYVSWVGLDLQVGAANPAMTLGTALANEPIVADCGLMNDACASDDDCCSGYCHTDNKCKD